MRLLPLGLLAASLWAADSVPEWVSQVAAQQTPTYPAKASAVVLLNEEHVTVNADGRRVTNERTAIKILQKSTESRAAHASYNSKSGRITSFQGWLLPPSGKPVVFGKNAVVDRAASTDYTYSETRWQSLDPGKDLAPGTVFAWEIMEEEKSVFGFRGFGFQGDEPVRVSRLILTLPAGWSAAARTFNHAPVEPKVEGTTYTWELRDLPFLEYEEHSPGFHAVAPRLGVNYLPGDGAGAQIRTLKDWSAVSAWFTEMEEPSAEVTPAIRAKAAELTADAKTEMEKIRTIADFVQATNYVEILIDIAHGGGFTPRAAEKVLATHYGDCKDKATLMRALAKAIGIDSYLVSISIDRDFVKPEWPAPQFNHAILAMKVSAETKLPAILDHARLGRLLFFDPTSAATSLGDLPQYEQGGYALIDAGTQGDLVRAPLLPPEECRVESKVDAKLAFDGRLAAHIDRTYHGQSARPVRGLMEQKQSDALKRSFEAGLSTRLGGVKLDKIEPVDKPNENRLDLKLDFSLTQFGRIMQNRMLIVAPGELALGAGYDLPAKERKLPVKLMARMRKDSVTLAIPAGLKMDELPDAVKIESPYGSYQAKWKVDGSTVLFEHIVEVKDAMVPAADYAKVRKFFEDVAGAQTSPVVLLVP